MEKLAAILWGPPVMVLFLLTGAVLTWRTGFVQIREFPRSLKQVFASVKSADRSAFRAVCTALAGTVGTGNIAGVAGALSLGGPGAVFWMWVAAFFGMATKYAEVVLAMKYRTPDGRGGPMYYILYGMGARWAPLAKLFAFFAVLASFGMGNIAQINTVASSVAALFPPGSRGNALLLTGMAVAGLTALVIWGGSRRVGLVTEKLVPWMAGIYVAASVYILTVYHRQLGDVLAAIFRGAFCPEAVLGGGVGISIRHCMRMGLSRGVFSNEAGLGSAPMAHAASGLSPHEQGLLGIFEVFFDTGILCSLTAFAILAAPVEIPYGSCVGASLAGQAMACVLGPWAKFLLAAIMSLLALGTLFCWQLYGSQCARFLWGRSGVQGYRLCYVAVIVLGATMDLSGAWAVSDVCNGLMCLPNLIALLALRNKVKNRLFSA